MASSTLVRWTALVLLPCCVWGFLPNQFTMVGSGTDYTHQDITEIGILLAVADYFEAHPPAGKSIAHGELSGIKDITARKLFDNYFGGTISEKRFQEAIDDIVKANNRVDQDHYGETTWHFNGEAIKEGNDKIIVLRETAIGVMNKTRPNYDAARDLVGQFLHIIQMFYSNTNWPEMKGKQHYDALGIRGQPLMAQAPQSMDTCSSCGVILGLPCSANLLIHGPMLTSGYRSGQDRFKPYKDPKRFTSGKCSHGGPYDQTAKTVAATGGINKDTSDPSMSPHFRLHDIAAQGAITHTRVVFGHPMNGLRRVLGDKTFKELLQLNPGTSMVFVIDTTGSMGNDLKAVTSKTEEIIRETMGTINQPYNYIVVTFNDPGSKTEIFESKNGTAVVAYLHTIRVGGGMDCPEFSLTGLQAAATVANPNSKIYVFTDATPKDANKINYVTSMVTEKKISVDFVLTGDCQPKSGKRHAGSDYVSEMSGGQVHDLNGTFSTKAETKHMAMLTWGVVNGHDDLSFYVDDSVTELRILVQANARPIIQDPTGRNVDSAIKQIGNDLYKTVIKIPKRGLWTAMNPLPGTMYINVYGESMFDVTDNFLQTNHMDYTLPIEGSPVIGETITHSVTFSEEDIASTEKNAIILYDAFGHEILRSALARVGRGRHNYIGQTVVPDQPFRVGVLGEDSLGQTYQRLKPSIIRPSILSLTMIQAKGLLRVGEDLQMDVKIANAGEMSMQLEVTATASDGVVVEPKQLTLHLDGLEHSIQTFVIHGGSVPGISTTVKISTSGGHSEYQYISRSYTVHH